MTEYTVLVSHAEGLRLISFVIRLGAGHVADLSVARSGGHGPSGPDAFERIASEFPDGRRLTLAELKSRLPGVGRLEWERPVVAGCRVVANAVDGGIRFELGTVTGFNIPPTDAEIARATASWLKARALLLQ